MNRPLSPAFFLTTALALVDDAEALDAKPCGMFSGVTRRYLPPNDGGDAGDIANDGWSAAFVHHVGYWSHFDYAAGRSVWPLPATASCSELAAFAASHFLLAGDAPESGDIYLLWSPVKKAFVRAGIVLRNIQPLPYPSGRIHYQCLTIDGDTTPSGSRRGPYTAIVQRSLSPDRGDRLVRWPLLDLIASERYWSVRSALGRAA